MKRDNRLVVFSNSLIKHQLFKSKPFVIYENFSIYLDTGIRLLDLVQLKYFIGDCQFNKLIQFMKSGELFDNCNEEVKSILDLIKDGVRERKIGLVKCTIGINFCTKNENKPLFKRRKLSNLVNHCSFVRYNIIHPGSNELRAIKTKFVDIYDKLVKIYPELLNYSDIRKFLLDKNSVQNNMWCIFNSIQGLLFSTEREHLLISLYSIYEEEKLKTT